MAFDFKTLTVFSGALTSAFILFGAATGQSETGVDPISSSSLLTYFLNANNAGTTAPGLQLNSLTTTQQNALASPAAGWAIWNSTYPSITAHDGTNWQQVLTSKGASANTWQLGAADAAAPVAQTLKVQSATGSNISAVNTTIIGSLSTGSGTSGDIIFQTGGTGAGAAVQNTAISALTIKGATQVLQLSSGTGTCLINPGVNNLGLGGNGTYGFMVAENATPNGIYLTSDRALCWNSSAASGSLPSATADLILVRDGANTLAQRNSTTAQVARVYNTYTSSTSYERGCFDWAQSSNVLTIGTEKGSGGGSTRNLQFIIGGTDKLDYGVTTASTWTMADTLALATGVNLRINEAPTAVSGASVLISSAADGAANIGHRIRINMNGVTYWVPASQTAF